MGAFVSPLGGSKGRMQRIGGLSWQAGSQFWKRSGPLTVAMAAEEDMEYDEVDLRGLKVSIA